MRKEPKMSPAAGQLYEAAEVVLDDADNFYSNWIDVGRRELTFFDHSVISLRAATDLVARQMMALAAENGAAVLHHARKLMRAKDANEALALHFEFYRQRLEAFSAQTQNLGKTLIEAAARAS